MQRRERHANRSKHRSMSVRSSGVAGTMMANGSNLQWSIVRSLMLAMGLYWLFRLMFRAGTPMVHARPAMVRASSRQTVWRMTRSPVLGSSASSTACVMRCRFT